MKCLLIGVNAKFIHTNLAIRLLKSYTEARLPLTIDTMEFTINQHPDQILREIYLKKPDLLGFSCYIWNYSMIRLLVAELKALLPDCILLLGGPEVSFHAREALEETGADLVICGEGEDTFCALAEHLENGRDFSHLDGIAFWREGITVLNPPAPPLEMDVLPFVYNELPVDRIVYYEASRGCPFSCQYCLSGGGKRVRFRSLSLVFSDLDRFLRAGVRQIKFVDRTFNCDKDYAMAIWRYLSEHDNGFSNFHFELAAELLEGEMLSFLNTVRKGLLQFEIGVQSTNPQTLQTVRRVTLPEKLTPVIRRLQAGRNIHLHLDLIAGLPCESYDRFGESFDYVYSLEPDQLQLGFLKLLKGSGLYRDRDHYGLRCLRYPPYEVTGTPWLSYDEILRLKMLAEMVELYYNSQRYRMETAYLCGLFPSSFRFFEALARFYTAEGYHLEPPSKLATYTILWDFLHTLERGDADSFQWMAKYDICCHEKPKKFPEWLAVGFKEDYRKAIFSWFNNEENIEQYLPEYRGLDPRQLIRSAHIEVFPFHPVTGERKRTAMLFNYRRYGFPGQAEAVSISIIGESTT